MSGFPVVRVACRHVFSRPLQFFTLALALALGSALASFLFLAVSGLQDGLARAVEPFSLLVGAKGSQYQLTTNSIFLQDAPLGNAMDEETGFISLVRIYANQMEALE